MSQYISAVPVGSADFINHNKKQILIVGYTILRMLEVMLAIGQKLAFRKVYYVTRYYA